MENTWKTVHELLAKTRRKKSFPQLFKDGENVITDKLETDDRLNSFFADIGPKLAEGIIMPINKNYKTNRIRRNKHPGLNSS